jgi:hypothetical protein
MAIRKFPQSQVIPTPTYLEEIRAKTAAGLNILDFSGNLGIFIEDGGRVGIGDSDPEAMLDIYADIEVPGIKLTIDPSYPGSTNEIRMQTLAINNQNMISFYNQSVREAFIVCRNNIDYSDPDPRANRLSFYDATSERITMLQGGNLGIGTNFPSSKLDVKGDIEQNSIFRYTDLLSLADDGTTEISFSHLTRGVYGKIIAGDDDEDAEINIASDGTVTLIHNSDNVENSDVDGSLCIYGSGTNNNIIIKNRLGAVKNIRWELRQ